MPAWGTLLSRLQTILDARWHARLSGRAAQGIAQETPDAPFPTPVVFGDGTGVGFHTPFDAPFRRGAEIRRLRSHLDFLSTGGYNSLSRGVSCPLFKEVSVNEGSSIGQTAVRQVQNYTASWGCARDLPEPQT